MSKLVLVLFVLALALAPRPSGGSQTPEPARSGPRVDLRRIAWQSGRARAPDAAGKQLPLTLEHGLQRAAEQLLARAAPSSAGAVLIDARRGTVLVWAEHLARGMSPGHMLLEHLAPAASVFKLVTAAALLETARVDPRLIVCHSGGRFSIERAQLERPRRGPMRCDPFADALGHSRNAVFAQLTTRYLARQDLIDMGARLGFNRPLPFDAEIAMGSLRVPFSDLAVARTAVGFRDNSLSVLGAAHLAMVVASGGHAVRLRIVEQDDATGSLEVSRRVLRERTARQLTRMMEVTVHSGTSLAAFSDENGRSYLGSIRVAGKTGTLHPNEPTQTTSWFVGFAPSRRPEVVVSVLLQNGRIWRQKANQVARDLLRAYFAARGAPGVTDPLDAGR